MSDDVPRPGAKGFSTRAIRAASRSPLVDQAPTGAPVNQTAGITPGLLRVSVGLEDLEDLQADFSAALELAGRSVPALGAV